MEVPTSFSNESGMDEVNEVVVGFGEVGVGKLEALLVHHGLNRKLFNGSDKVVME